MSLGIDHLPGIPTDEEWKEAYEQISSHRLVHWDYYYALSVFRLIIIIQFMSMRDMPAEFRTTQKPLIDFMWQNLHERID